MCSSDLTIYRYYDGTDVAKLFDLQSDDFMYSRLGSPTVSFLEKKMAKLEGGTAAVTTSSGQSANLMAILNICEAGDHIISTSAIYGGTHNLFKVTLKKMGIDTTFINPCTSEKESSIMQRSFSICLPSRWSDTPKITTRSER